MDSTQTASIMALAAVVGVGGFCLSYAIAVWRSRNRATQLPARSGRLLGTGAWTLVIAGGGLLAMLAIRREVDGRQGVLRTDSLLTVRAQEGLEPIEIVAADEVAEGAVAARFVSPERRSRLRVLTLEQERWRSEQEVVRAEPPALDPELVRHHQRAALDMQILRGSLDQILPAKEAVRREALQARLGREQQLRELDSELAAEHRRRKQAAARLVYLEKLAGQIDRLSQSSMASEKDQAATEADRKVAAEEVDKADERIAFLGRERQQVEEALRSFDELAQAQAEVFAREEEQIRARYAQAAEQERDYSSALATDRARAERLQRERMAQLDLQARACEAEAEGIQEILTVRAPFAGRVVFREPSPRTAYRQAPLLVVARDEGFRALLPLPREEAALLAEAEHIELALRAPSPDWRFPARFLRARPLAEADDTVEVELLCSPPDECIRALARDESVAVDLAWRAPLHRLALGQVGGLLGLLGLLLAVLRLFVGGTSSASAVGAAPAALAWSEVEGVIELQGMRLLEGLRRAVVDDPQLTALEWAMDRHHERAVAVLRRVLGQAEDLHGIVTTTLGALATSQPQGGDNGHPVVNLAERLTRLMRVLFPATVTELRLRPDPLLVERPHRARHRPAASE